MPRTVASSDPFAGATTAANDQRPTLYEVQANDNYWSISKKQYGTYRYFDALAKYNAERVPDPTKLRPGMKVMTPPPQALEASFPEMFGKGGAVTASYVPESESDEPGRGPAARRCPRGGTDRESNIVEGGVRSAGIIGRGLARAAAGAVRRRAMPC